MEKNRWVVGQEVKWPKVEPYVIKRLVGTAGNIHVSNSGRWHSYWHRVVKGKTTLVHHGGPEGFPTIQKVQRQHERIILKYVGVSIDLKPEDTGSAETSDLELTLPTIAENLQSLEIPGEQAKITLWIDTLQKTARDIPLVRDKRLLDMHKKNLESLLRSSHLGRSINAYKSSASEAIAAAILGNRADLLAGVTEAQRDLLLRSYEVVDILKGTMERYTDLDRLQAIWNRVLIYLPHGLARPVYYLQRPELIDSLPRTMDAEILGKNSVYKKLESLDGESYLGVARKFIEDQSPIIRLWHTGQHADLLKMLLKQAQAAEIVKRRVEDQEQGYIFGKYATS